MLLEAVPLSFVVEFGIVGETELDGAADDDVAVEVAVSFGHNLPVDAARRVGG